MPHTLPESTDDHVHVATVDHPDSPVGVWLDTRPDMRAVLIEFEAYDRHYYIPAEIAGAVAEAILSAVAPDAAWCNPARCATVQAA